jgi:hypothetical protein
VTTCGTPGNTGWNLRYEEQSMASPCIELCYYGVPDVVPEFPDEAHSCRFF